MKRCYGLYSKNIHYLKGKGYPKGVPREHYASKRLKDCTDEESDSSSENSSESEIDWMELNMRKQWAEMNADLLKESDFISEKSCESSESCEKSKIEWIELNMEDQLDQLKNLVRCYVKEKGLNENLQDLFVDSLPMGIALNLQNLISEAYHLKSFHEELLKMEHFNSALKYLNFPETYITPLQKKNGEYRNLSEIHLNTDSVSSNYRKNDDTEKDEEALHDVNNQSHDVEESASSRLAGEQEVTRSKNLVKLEKLVSVLIDDPDTKHLIYIFENLCREKRNSTILMEFLSEMDILLSDREATTSERKSPPDLKSAVDIDARTNKLLSLLLHWLHANIHFTNNRKICYELTGLLAKFVSRSSYKLLIHTKTLPIFKYCIMNNPELDCFFSSHILWSIQSLGLPVIKSVIPIIFPNICNILDKSMEFSHYCKGNISLKEVDTDKLSDKWIANGNGFHLYFQLLYICETVIESVLIEDITPEQEEYKVIPEDSGGVCLDCGPEKTKSFFSNCFEYFGNALTARLRTSFARYEECNRRRKQYLTSRCKLYLVDNMYMNLEGYLKYERVKYLKKVEDEKNAEKIEVLESSEASIPILARNRQALLSNDALTEKKLHFTKGIHEKLLKNSNKTPFVRNAITNILLNKQPFFSKRTLTDKELHSTERISEKLLKDPNKERILKEERSVDKVGVLESFEDSISILLNRRDLLSSDDLTDNLHNTEIIPENLLKNLSKKRILKFDKRPEHWINCGDLKMFI